MKASIRAVTHKLSYIFNIALRSFEDDIFLCVFIYNGTQMNPS